MSGNSNILPLLAIIIPFISAFFVGIFGSKNVKIQKGIAFFATLFSFIIACMLIKPVLINNGIISYWMGSWIPEKHWAIGIGLEVDGFGLFVGLIITLTCFLSSIYSFRYMENDNGLDKYYILFLMLTASMIGFVFTGDLFNMYVMLEIMTFAAIALTAFRNHLYKSIEAGFKYIVTGSIGSSFILLGTVLLYAQVHTLNLAQISVLLHGREYTPVTILALAFLLTGYAVKAFLVPCHTWPPDAHMSAPSSISMLLSGVMSKTGVYGIVRIIYMIYRSMGLTQMEFLIIFWGTVTMFIGVSMALMQTDFKRLLAFHSVSQIGYVITGFGVGLAVNSKIATLGTMSGLYHMLNHATFKCLLFLCAGAVLYRTGTTNLNELGGLSKKMPYTTALFLIGAASISGIPPFNGFVSKWLIYQSTYEAGYAPVTIIALLVSVMTLASFVKVGQSVFFGQMPQKYKDIKDIPLSMKIPMTVLAGVCIVFGVFPNFVSKFLLRPASYAIYNIGNYIDVMFGKGYAAKMFNGEVAIPNIDYVYAGYWNPKSWLVLFFILLIGFMLVFAMSGDKKESQPADLMDTKYGIFTGGEKEEFSHIAGHDLFWGFKFNLKGFLMRITKAHSGIVNDYVLWIVSCLAIVTIYLFSVLP